MKKQKEPSRLVFTVILAVFVFCVLSITMFLVGTAVYLLVNSGILHLPQMETMLVMTAVVSIILGTVISFFLGNIPTKPIYRLIDALNELAAGNYAARLSLRIPRVGKELEDSFNLLAQELQNTEMLRSDFVNNFSHEFKTPLVSIQGFAKLLQKGGLTAEEEKEYTAIIAEESARLADMATKVLDLTKLENQNILTDVTEFNLSEQLRACILLLERKWSAKRLFVSANFGEETIRGNEEMLKQVWINLLDNAVKFSPDGGTLSVGIRREPHAVLVDISNNGPAISVDDQKRIFQKFYQADKAHSAQGNGIGLAIVRRIAALHGGEVRVESDENLTTFTVLLPV